VRFSCAASAKQFKIYIGIYCRMSSELGKAFGFKILSSKLIIVDPDI
jgi:hypothetical protein